MTTFPDNPDLNRFLSLSPRERDGVVATILMDDREIDGWWCSLDGTRYCHADGGPAEYTTHPVHTMRLVEWMHRRGLNFTLNSNWGLRPGVWAASFEDFVARLFWIADGDSAGAATAHAALRWYISQVSEKIHPEIEETGEV